MSEAEDRRYTPLDETLAMPVTRLLRALRWFDWTRPSDLYVVLELAEHEKSAYSAALSRMTKSGLVERGDHSTDGWAYRLSDAGRAELDRRLRGEWSKRRAA